jgi:hypothetical protein
MRARLLLALILPTLFVAPAFAANLSSTSAGGWIPGNAGGKATFGLFAAIQDDGTVTGHLVYSDHGIDFELRSTTITSIASTACQTTITGMGESTGGPVNFIVTVVDGGEPGGNTDAFAIEAGGYASANLLGGGNVKVHGQSCP